MAWQSLEDVVHCPRPSMALCLYRAFLAALLAQFLQFEQAPLSSGCLPRRWRQGSIEMWAQDEQLGGAHYAFGQEKCHQELSCGLQSRVMVALLLNMALPGLAGQGLFRAFPSLRSICLDKLHGQGGYLRCNPLLYYRSNIFISYAIL